MMRRFFPSTIRQAGTPPNTAGETFEVSATPADLSWYGVAYGNGIWVAVADTGTNPAMSSLDGITWTQRTATNQRWRDVCFSQTLNLFCACSLNGTFRIMTSPDGITWTNRTAGFATTWFGVFYGNGYFVSCGNGRIQYSADGITWTAVVVPAGDYRCVTYSPDLDLWVIAGSQVIATATDPTGTWTARAGATGQVIVDIVWAEGQFFGTDFNSNTTAGIYSTDGITWSSSIGIGGHNRNTVAFGNSLWFIGGGTTGSTLKLEDGSDGITWAVANAKFSITNGTIQRMRYADNKFVGVISGGSNGFRAFISQ